MSCKDYELADVFDYTDGSLESRRRLSFEAHITACAHCRGALEDVRRIASGLERTALASVPEPPPGLRAAVLADADAMLKRMLEEGTAPARPSVRGSAPTHQEDSHRPSLSPERLSWRSRPIPRFIGLAAAVLLAIVGIYFFTDRNVVASITDGDGLYVNDVEYKGGSIQLYPNARIRTDKGRAGSFLSASGESVVLGPSSELLVKDRDADGCLVLVLESGHAWVVIGECEEGDKPGGVDFERPSGGHASVGKEAFVYCDPAGYRIESALGDGSSAPTIEEAKLDDIVVALVPNVHSRTAGRARAHYDRVKRKPVHWVKSIAQARVISWNLRRPILVVDENGDFSNDLFEKDEALRNAASKFVCVRVQRGAEGLDDLLSKITDPEKKSLPRILLCPEEKLRAAFSADASIADIVAEMEKVCTDVTNNWNSREW